MSDLPLFWHFWVAGLTLIGLLFLLVLAIRIYYPKTKHTEEDVVWDETLIESPSPPPEWWFWLIIATLFFSALYLIFYPGLGNYNGLFDLTTAKRYAESKANLKNQYYAKLATLENQDYQQLQQNQDAMKLAAHVFRDNCAVCHGEDAKGQSIFPNLKDNDWQWGNDTEQIKHTIKEGRIAVMPPWSLVLGGDSGVGKMANLIQNFDNRADENHKEAFAKYNQFCATCHGANAKGNQALGAPDLTDDIWLYGGDIANIKQSISEGRKPPKTTHNKSSQKTH